MQNVQLSFPIEQRAVLGKLPLLLLVISTFCVLSKGVMSSDVERQGMKHLGRIFGLQTGSLIFKESY